MALNFRGRLLAAAEYVCSYSGLVDAHRLITRRVLKPSVPILLYHHVGNHNYPWAQKQISTANFEAQMSFLAKNYEVMPLSKILNYLTGNRVLPRNAVVITFDDGHKDNYLNAYPILKKYHMPATIFLATGYIDSASLFWWDKIRYAIWNSPREMIDLGKLGLFPLYSPNDKLIAMNKLENMIKKVPEEYKQQLIRELLEATGVKIPPSLGKELILSWDEVREMNNDEINFGCHTVNHVRLTGVLSDTAKWEIIESKTRIETELKQRIVAFAYPYGNRFDYNEKIKSILKNAGLLCALTASPPGTLNAISDPYELCRTGSANAKTFKFCLHALPDIYTKLKIGTGSN